VSKKTKGINPDLEKAVSDLLKSVMLDPEASLTDKTKVIDRALHLEKIKQKISDEEWGSGLMDNEEDNA
jgi:hypothetical protein